MSDTLALFNIARHGGTAWCFTRQHAGTSAYTKPAEEILEDGKSKPLYKASEKPRG